MNQSRRDRKRARRATETPAVDSIIEAYRATEAGHTDVDQIVTPTEADEIIAQMEAVDDDYDLAAPEEFQSRVGMIGSVGYSDLPLKRAFRKRSYILDDGFDVAVKGADAVENDIYIEATSNRLVILTGELARAAKAESGAGNVVGPGLVGTRSLPSSQPALTSNASTFHSPSKLHGTTGYPELQGSESAPVKVDRTLNQRRMLAVAGLDLESVVEQERILV
jgi:hypothetical protein